MTAAVKIESFRSIDNTEKDKGPEIKNGHVVSIMPNYILLDIAGEKQKAEKAFSCFIEPVVGDKVICSKDETGILYILGIIKRNEQQNITFSYPADTDMISENGSLNFRSKDSLALASKNLSLFSNKAIHKSREAIVALDDITATGSSFRASFQTVKLISHMISTMAKQVIERFHGYIRNTESNDQVRAGQMTRCVDEMYSMDSKYTVMVSKKDTKIDGERIHMG